VTTSTGTASVIVIGGPTASGKSGLAVDLAERLDGVVINADSMQVYRDLRVLTARPDAVDEARAPHRLFGILDAGDVCSAARWRNLAIAEIAAAHAAGRRAIVVGGSGLYLNALMFGLAAVPPVPGAIRAAARARLAAQGSAALHAALAARDPAMAARLTPGDGQRIVRAWEVLEATGRSLADWQVAGVGGAAAFVYDVVLLLPPRSDLHGSCDARFVAMVAGGALDEVRKLEGRLARNELTGDVPLLKALGVPELRALLRGETTRDAAIAAAQQATRRFAKRQTTWFRHQVPAQAAPPLNRVVRTAEKYSVDLSDRIFSEIS
jgi:tRNA dimethylallyltransferase